MHYCVCVSEVTHGLIMCVGVLAESKRATAELKLSRMQRALRGEAHQQAQVIFVFFVIFCFYTEIYCSEKTQDCRVLTFEDYKEPEMKPWQWESYRF